MGRSPTTRPVTHRCWTTSAARGSQLIEQPGIGHVVDRLPGRAWLRRFGDTQRVSLVGRHESVLLLNLGSGLTQTIWHLLSLQANAKTLEGAQHPDRDAQFCYLNDQAQAHLASGDPVISVDTKKKEPAPRGALPYP